MSDQYLVIAGANGGKRINVVPAVQPAYQLLEEKARDGSYWARVAVSSLRALASGRLGKDNVFVRPGSLMTQNYEAFAVFLPGCKACM